jgi:hypothetical protein
VSSNPSGGQGRLSVVSVVRSEERRVGKSTELHRNEVGWEDVERTELAQDRVLWRILEKRAMKLRYAWRSGNFFSA